MDIDAAVLAFDVRMPAAAEHQAAKEAIRLFSETPDQQTFLRSWRKLRHIQELQAGADGKQFETDRDQLLGAE